MQFQRLYQTVWLRYPWLVLQFQCILVIGIGTSAQVLPVSLDLNEWLQDFKDCYVNVNVLERSLDIDNGFSFPITLYYNSASELHVQLRRRVFCSTQVFLLSEAEVLTREVVIPGGLSSSILEKQFESGSRCSTPSSRNPEILKWTHSHCTLIIAGVRKADWVPFLASAAKPERSLLFNLHMDSQNTEYFVLFAEDVARSSGEAEVIYLCRFCTPKPNLTETTIPCQNGVGCRDAIEEIVENVTQDGRNVGARFPTHSDLDSYFDETTLGEHTTVLFTSSPLEKLSYLKYLSSRSYWKDNSLSFTKIIQALLFEEVDEERANKIMESRGMSDIWSLIMNNFHFISYRTFGMLKENYAANVYLTGTDYFNFVTCHGLGDGSPVEVYVKAFDLTTWCLLLAVVLFSLIILVMVLFLLNRKGTAHPLQTLSNICFYTGSMLLENGSRTYLPKFRSRTLYVLNFVFGSLSIVCIVLGNSYKGILTRDIISPIHVQIRVELMEELQNFTLVVLPVKGLELTEKEFLHKLLENRRRTGEKGGLQLSAFSKQLFYEGLSFRKNGNPEKADFIFGLNDLISVHPNEVEARETASHCDKVAIVGFRDELFRIMSFPGSEMVLAYGKDRFLPTNSYWTLPALVGRYFHKRMSAIISSGIHQMWEGVYYFKSRNSDKLAMGRNDVVHSRQQGVRGKLTALSSFIVLGLAALLAIFVVEIIVGS